MVVGESCNHPLHVEDDRDRREQNREIEHRAALGLGQLGVLERRVGPGEVDDHVRQILTSLPAAAAAVVDLGSLRRLLELIDRGLLERLREGGPAPVERDVRGPRDAHRRQCRQGQRGGEVRDLEHG
jgi:hypothetical protein